MEKECEYCGNEFHANRKDAKYCSKTCKNEAYLARKVNGIPASGQVEGAPSRVISSTSGHNRQNVSRPFRMNSNTLDSIITGARTNEEVFQHLLSEKDLSGDIKSERSKLEITLMFIERDLATAEKTISEQDALITKLESQIEKSDSFMGRIMDVCEKNPTILMGITTAIGNLTQIKADPKK